MKLCKPLASIGLVLTLSFAFTFTAKAEDFAIGTKVDAQPWGPDWRNGTITGTVQGGYVVKLDNGDDYVCPSYRVRGFTGTGISDKPTGTGSGAGSSSSSGGTTSSNGNNSSGTSSSKSGTTGGGSHGSAKPSYSTGTGSSSSGSSSTSTYVPPGQTGPISKGKGKPPDGTYACVLWTAGMMVNIGKLEIKGNQYRGLNKQSGFHSFSVDGNGNMALSAGLSGMPDGFTMKSVGYVGTTSSGKDLIHIKYIGRYNAHEKMDAIREN